MNAVFTKLTGTHFSIKICIMQPYYNCEYLMGCVYSGSYFAEIMTVFLYFFTFFLEIFNMIVYSGFPQFSHIRWANLFSLVVSIFFFLFFLRFHIPLAAIVICARIICLPCRSFNSFVIHDTYRRAESVG